MQLGIPRRMIYNVTGNRLLFTSISSENTGKYRCRAHTSEGILETSALLNVENDEETEAEKRRRKHLHRPKTTKRPLESLEQPKGVEYTLAENNDEERKQHGFHTEVVELGRPAPIYPSARRRRLRRLRHQRRRALVRKGDVGAVILSATKDEKNLHKQKVRGVNLRRRAERYHRKERSHNNVKHYHHYEIRHDLPPVTGRHSTFEGTLIPPIEESIVSIVEPDPLLPAESRGVNELEVQAAETETKENDVFTHPASTIEFLGTGPIELTSERNQTLDFIDMEIQVIILKLYRVDSSWLIEIFHRKEASLRVNSEVPSELIYSTPVRTDKPSTKVFGSSRIFLGGVDPYRTQKIQKSSLPFVGSIGRLRLNDKEVDLKNLKEIQGGIPLEENTQQKSSLEQRVNECSREPCKNSGRCFLDRWGVFQVENDFVKLN
uniref:Ig-like domain-containing protein n=1 Tax=Meloidogyne hapla TaxID=6305 RepID=A0A1I8BFT2_MELHA